MPWWLPCALFLRLKNLQGEDKKRVQEDRGLAVDAAVVRIMKSRKVLSHNDLVRLYDLGI